MKTIYVIGYPRSGNVWLSRSLGDMFDCSINEPTGGNSVARRSGNSEEYRVIQGHYSFRENYEDKNVFIGKRKYMNPTLKPKDDYLIFLYRNPFDVAVSVYKYWRRKDLKEALRVMRDGGLIPIYKDWMTRWLDNAKYFNMFISYEQMHYSYNEILKKIADHYNYKPTESIEAIKIYNQIKPTRSRVKQNPENFSYHPGIQLRHLRKGVIGDWINHFTVKDIDYAFEFMGEIICSLGYYPDWCKNIKDVYKAYVNSPEETFAKEVYEDWNI